MQGMLLRTILLLSISAAAVAQDEVEIVERRGTEPAVTGRITVIDDVGVSVLSTQGATHFIPWDRVRRLVTDRPRAGLDRRLETAEALWRARSRVERNDTALAEPLLERLFEQYRGHTHETALVVAEGLLRCRLARGANAAAVICALEVSRLRRAGIDTGSYTMLAPVIDEETSLCPQLAPAWINSRALVKLHRDLAEYDAGDDAVVAAMARLYSQAVRRQLALQAPPEAEENGERLAPQHGGVELLANCVACGAAEAELRQAARDRLHRRFETMPPWAEAWARFAIGRSLLGESGIGRQQRGLLNLVHLPARFARSQPYLAGLALAWAAEASEARGDDATAAVFRAELARRLPNHPLHTVADPIGIPHTKDAQ